jgi:hypothetical protein
MTWVYDVKKLTFELNGKYQFSALYAGAPGYKNDPKFECVINKGPLPRGKYRITGIPFTHRHAGKFTLRLEPYKSNMMCGRSGFLIHGDSTQHPGEASNGCIILSPKYRKIIWESNDKEVVVI